MAFNFNGKVDRRGTGCIKWDFQEMDYDISGILPYSIADSDFVTEPKIIEALHKRVEHGIFGYSDITDEYLNAIVEWFDKHFSWNINKESIVPTSGIVPLLSFAVEALTGRDDNVVVQPPVYDPFYTVIKNNGRNVLENYLINDNGYYKMNFKDLESKLAIPKTTMMILCSPANPVGRVWSFEELKTITKLCKKHNVFLVSDEMHCDIVFGNVKHTPVGKFKEIEDNLLVCTAPSKTFNLAGLQTSNIIIPNKEIRKKITDLLYSKYMFCPNILGMTACTAAYLYGDSWLIEQNKYLKENVEYVIRFFNEKLPQITVTKLEGTYLMWIDLTSLGMKGDNIVRILAHEFGVGVNNGEHYSSDCDGFIRFNVACTRDVVEQGVKQIYKFYISRSKI